jgi:Prophage protein (DUF1660)
MFSEALSMRDKRIARRVPVLLCRLVGHRGAPFCFTENDTRCVRCGDIVEPDSLYKSNRRRTARLDWDHPVDNFR